MVSVPCKPMAQGIWGSLCGCDDNPLRRQKKRAPRDGVTTGNAEVRTSRDYTAPSTCKRALNAVVMLFCCACALFFCVCGACLVSAWYSEDRRMSSAAAPSLPPPPLLTGGTTLSPSSPSIAATRRRTVESSAATAAGPLSPSPPSPS